MSYKIYRIETYGAKNIKEKISFDFLPQTIKNYNNQTTIKAIYGANGAGKSAFINSVYLYKQLTSNLFYLKQDNVIRMLNKLINKTIKEFYFSITFYNTKLPKKVFRHTIKIIIDQDSIPYILEDRFEILNDKTINGIFDPIYEINNGELKIYKSPDNKELYDFILDVSKNILKYTTISSLLLDKDISTTINNLITPKSILKSNINIIESLFIIYKLSQNFTIFIEAQDTHFEINEIETFMFAKQYIEDEDLRNKINISTKKDIILKSDLNNYHISINKLLKLLKLFKPDLKDIKVEIQEDKDFLYCSKKLVYDNYVIDSDYESTGLQKLMRIFNSLEDVTKNRIVFIDELDANIDNVYLNTLLKYFYESKKGQLCFTSHSHFPMHYLCNIKNSIDFIVDTGKLVPWKKNGNYKPFNRYPEGMIIGAPYNISYLDFVDVFEGDNICN